MEATTTTTTKGKGLTATDVAALVRLGAITTGEATALLLVIMAGSAGGR